MDLNKKIAIITESVRRAAQSMREDAGYSGRMDDGGASMTERQLEAWLDGIAFTQTGQSKMYAHIISAYEKEQDPEYKEYLRLKEKFN